MQINVQLYKVFRISLAVLLVSCTTPEHTQEHTQEQELNFISEMKGSVEIQDNGKGKYKTAYIGDTVNTSDKLRLSKDASAKIMCNNLSLWQINSQGDFPVSKGCPSTKTTVFRKNISTDNTRGLNNPKIPYLISPRNTAILNEQPTLYWNPISGAINYQVEISSGEEFKWTTTVSQPTVTYSGNQPMQPGIYKVNITANNGASTKGNDDSVFFIVQTKEHISQINSYIAQLQQKPLNNNSKSFALAHLYRNHDFNAKAIELLEKSIKEGNQTTAVYELLGSIYQKIGLNQLARERYLSAIKSAKGEGNLKVQENIQYELENLLSYSENK